VTLISDISLSGKIEANSILFIKDSMAQDLLIVVGAGASKEFGLPIGAELKTEIANLVNLRADRFQSSLSSGDGILWDAVQIESRSRTVSVNDFFHAARHIHDAIPQAPSIDNFIDVHAGNSNIEVVGKLAIARSILKAERSSKLYFSNQNTKNRLRFGDLEDTWLTKLFRLLTENCRVIELAGRLSRISLIVFNYDRCIEHFLFNAIRNYYRIDDELAARLVNMIEIYHPYGKVGALPWDNEPGTIEFGGEPSPMELLNLAKGIKTFTEGTDPESSEIINIRKQVAAAKTTLFLGFGFHRLNMDLLSSPAVVELELGSQKKSFATAFGMSNSDVAIVQQEVKQLTKASMIIPQVRNDLMCYQLFNEYARSISMI
jgi:hypothetical protein